jgi:hypothetical protein
VSQRIARMQGSAPMGNRSTCETPDRGDRDRATGNLATRDARHFAALDIAVVNAWTDGASVALHRRRLVFTRGEQPLASLARVLVSGPPHASSKGRGFPAGARRYSSPPVGSTCAFLAFLRSGA